MAARLNDAADVKAEAAALRARLEREQGAGIAREIARAYAAGQHPLAARAERGLRSGRIIEAIAAGELDQALDEAVMDVTMDVDPLDRAARLT